MPKQIHQHCDGCGDVFHFTLLQEIDGQSLCDDCYLEDGYYDDGQPSEYDEWQDYMGGDDWDHGQYDEAY